MTNGILDSAQKIISNGLLLNYDIAQLRSYPTTGTIITDLSGNNKNGTLINGISFNSLNGGNFLFDGVNDYVDLGVSTVVNLLNGAMASTFSIWINNNLLPATGIENYQSIGCLIQNNTLINCCFFGSNISIGGRSRIQDSYQVARTPYGSTNLWVNISGILDYTNDLIKIYINGILVKTQSVNFGSNTIVKGVPTVPDAIGSIQNTQFFNGKIGQFSLYNKELTSTEVLQNFNANRSRYGL